MLLFGERMSRAQYVGVATIIVAVAALGAVTS
jgi:multidrug transporter EmrE-like cation transporter